MGKYFRAIDFVTLVIILCLSAFGLFILLTIQQGLFAQQMLFILIGVGLMAFFSFTDSVLLWWGAPFAYAAANIFLLLSYLGPNIRGATRWIVIGGAQLQPSELVKPLLLIVFARFISQYPPRNFRNIPLHLLLFAVPFFLVFRQPDLGSSLVYASFWLAMMVAGGLPLWMLLSTFAFVGFATPALWHALADYQKQRITTFLNPSLDPRGAGYNALQAMIAVGSGQLFGRGLGRGTQSHLRFLPEFHTDFIFATLVEELGFAGGLLLIVGYGILLYRLLTPLLRGVVTEMFPFVYSVGLFAMLLSQIFINSGMNMGIIPITGITLPFVSYGGSSVLSLLISFGLLWSVRQAQTPSRSVAIR